MQIITEQKIKLRNECNLILKKIIEFNSNIFNLCYIQSLWTLGIIDTKYIQNDSYYIIDRYLEESYDTIVRILPRIIEIFNNKLPKDISFEDKIEYESILYWLKKLNFIQKDSNNEIKIIS